MLSRFPLVLPREFYLRMYVPEDRMLQFYAERTPTEATHIYLIFEDVREMKIRPTLRDVTVDLIEGGGYTLTTPDFPDGYVLSEKFHYAEDDVEDWGAFTSLNIDQHVFKRIYHPRP